MQKGAGQLARQSGLDADSVHPVGRRALGLAPVAAGCPVGPGSRGGRRHVGGGHRHPPLRQGLRLELLEHERLERRVGEGRRHRVGRLPSPWCRRPGATSWPRRRSGPRTGSPPLVISPDNSLLRADWEMATPFTVAAGGDTSQPVAPTTSSAQDDDDKKAFHGSRHATGGRRWETTSRPRGRSPSAPLGDGAGVAAPVGDERRQQGGQRLDRCLIGRQRHGELARLLFVERLRPQPPQPHPGTGRAGPTGPAGPPTGAAPPSIPGRAGRPRPTPPGPRSSGTRPGAGPRPADLRPGPAGGRNGPAIRL